MAGRLAFTSLGTFRPDRGCHLPRLDARNVLDQVHTGRLGYIALRSVRDRSNVWTATSGERPIRDKCPHSSCNGYARRIPSESGKPEW